MASIKKRGPNQWQAGIRRRGWPVQIKTFDSKVDAQAWARQMEGADFLISQINLDNACEETVTFNRTAAEIRGVTLLEQQ